MPRLASQPRSLAALLGLGLVLLFGCPSEQSGFDRGSGLPPCIPGGGPACAVASCEDLLPEAELSGLYWLQPHPSDEPFETFCDLATEGAGWTLVAVVADDGQDSWTWTERGLWSEPRSQLGSPASRDADFRSPALHSVRFEDLLFVHHPSALSAVYRDVGDGEDSLAGHVARDEASACLEPGQGAPLVGGSLLEREDLGSLCDTRLYFSPIDQDGDAGCDPEEANPSNAWGPAWNSAGNDGCPFDDVGENASLGPSSLEDPDLEFGAPSSDELVRGLGFGQALGLNSAPAGSGGNRVEVYVR